MFQGGTYGVFCGWGPEPNFPTKRGYARLSAAEASSVIWEKIYTGNGLCWSSKAREGYYDALHTSGVAPVGTQRLEVGEVGNGNRARACALTPHRHQQPILIPH